MQPWSAGSFLLLHGFVDVSGHRWGSFLAGTLLLGLAQFRPHPSRSSRWPPILFRFVGLLLALVSLGLAYLAGGAPLPLPGRLGVENTRHAASGREPWPSVHRSSGPCRPRIELGAARLAALFFAGSCPHRLARVDRECALGDFRRARFLEPNAYQLPFEEGKAWLGWQPTLAITAWREAFQRRGAEEAAIFPLMLADAANYDGKVHAALREFAINRPGLTINYLEAATQPQFEEELHDLLASDPELLQFTPRQKTRLFELWSNHDPLDELLRHCPDPPGMDGIRLAGSRSLPCRPPRI